MKRYRVLECDFDSRAMILKEQVQDSWEPQVKAQWQQNQIEIKEGLIARYGPLGCHQKISNFEALDSAPFSIIAFHNKFLRQARDAFVVGAYYPALTAACALGERMLNQLVLHLRDDYRSAPEYKKVYRKDSFDNWDVAIETLEAWDVLLPEPAAKFRELRGTRHRSLHFNPETDKNDRDLALQAIKTLTAIVAGQFSAAGKQPWFIMGVKGATFVKKAYEEVPFVKRIVLPSCRLVGARHTMELKHDTWIIHDDHDYGDGEITDEEFRDQFNSA